ncbi:precorrin-2 dehydrogenase/sirohydrochlorin ferrochelatase family protein [Tengunoibacter tsumagoiensis]|uniref:precorrin-2 dehydrogenase n=1 Tax=Tengunoibacter tsumagoiensis TaxID=2014871 RepID=A0A402A3Q2_9CHLR|nr:bifunctional precorrin-2 dehydrogenase/sirohydrochlorin ferrochelatase [Tengunoibacter tsumagoiensis]GCE13788.1 precorrin-2 dehydrogenase [Tengunoibacter tsumagoiensis]
MPNYYPIMLDVRDRLALVIGGDRVAAEKAAALSNSGARVTVMNAVFCDELQDLAQMKAVTLRYKNYAYGDLEGAFVVVASATYEPELAQAIWQEAQERNQLVNIVDVPKLCNFIVPSILRRGQLTISVSTEGASPGLAKRIRQRLEKLFPNEYASYLRIATVARQYLKEHALSYAQRDAFFEAYFHSDILELLVEGDEVEALATTVRLLRSHNVEVSAATILASMKETPINNGSYLTTE